MIPELVVTDETLARLGKQLGGCEFSTDSQRRFLTARHSCDVQAAPGNGKTTLLVAKLALLSEVWTSGAQGICVISHTNAARVEIEEKLAHHPSAAACLRYPHFVGTVTSFIDRFIALPYVRGLGWPVQRIDDEAFAAIATSRIPASAALRKYSYGKEYQLSQFVSGLELSPQFACYRDAPPARIEILKRSKQPGPASDTGKALEELKAGMIRDGYYRYADMHVIANRAITEFPRLLDVIRRRFPLVLLDEAQDTNGSSLALLGKVFSEGVAFQRLGDQNQTLYEDDTLKPEDYWTAGSDVIPLNETRRFGTEIAQFASRLTLRSQQDIVGKTGLRCRRSLILFDDFVIDNVMSAYADEVRSHWGDGLGEQRDVWAVASRHNPTNDTKGEWPKTLVDYCPSYRSGKGRSARQETLCGVLRQASLLFEAGGATTDVSDLLKTGVVDLLRHLGLNDASGERVGKRNIWTYLASVNPVLPLKIRRLLRDRVIAGQCAWSADVWRVFQTELVAMLFEGAKLPKAAEQYLEFVEEGAISQDLGLSQSSRTCVTHNGVNIKLGSIHSIKGKTVDAVLVVETEVWKGARKDEKAMDLTTVLPRAFGVENSDLTGSSAKLSAATNVFVASTRPREVLALAVRKRAVSAVVIEAAIAQGWNVVDLCKQQ